MKPLCKARQKSVRVLALIVALTIAPSISHAHDFAQRLGPVQSGVRFVGEPVAFGTQPVSTIDPIKLGDMKRGSRKLSVTIEPHLSMGSVPGRQVWRRIVAFRSDRRQPERRRLVLVCRRQGAGRFLGCGFVVFRPGRFRSVEAAPDPRGFPDDSAINWRARKYRSV